MIANINERKKAPPAAAKAKGFGGAAFIAICATDATGNAAGICVAGGAAPNCCFWTIVFLLIIIYILFINSVYIIVTYHTNILYSRYHLLFCMLFIHEI